MSKTIEERLAAIEAVIARIQAAFGPAAIGAASKASGGEIADDELLSKPWADKDVRKDPPRWKGESYVGRRLSECPADYLAQYADFCDWKAQKGKEDPAPRINEKTNKPWHEYDSLDAKLARGWAKRNAASGAGKAAVKAKPRPTFVEAPADDIDEGLPF